MEFTQKSRVVYVRCGKVTKKSLAGYFLSGFLLVRPTWAHSNG